MKNFTGNLLLTSVMFLGSPLVLAQTKITGAQIRNPLTPVSSLPATCSPYSVFFLTTTNIPYICTAPNTLTAFAPGQSGGSGGSGLPASGGTPGYLYTDGQNVTWGNILTAGSGALDCVTTPGQCDIVTSVVPRLAAANIWTGANDFSGAAWTKPFSVAASPPAAPLEGQVYYDTAAHTPFIYNGSAFASLGGGGGGSATPVYDGSGVLVSGVKVVTFSTVVGPGYQTQTYTLTGAAIFSSIPRCTFASSSINPVAYCLPGSGGCTATSSASQIRFYSNGIGDTINAICIGH